MSNNKNDIYIPHYLLSPVNYFGPGWSSFMNVLRSYRFCTASFISISSFVKEKLTLQGVWTYRHKDRVISIDICRGSYENKPQVFLNLLISINSTW